MEYKSGKPILQDNSEAYFSTFPKDPAIELAINILFANSDPKLFRSYLVLCYPEGSSTPTTKPSSLGKQIETSIIDSGHNIPSKVNTSLIISKPAFEKLNLDKYLHRFAAINNWDLVNWNLGTNDFKRTSSDIKVSNKNDFDEHYFNYANIDPYSLIAALTIAVKEHPSALGVCTPLLDLNRLEKMPEINKYIKQYNEQYKGEQQLI